MASVFYDYFGREAQNEQIRVRRIKPSDCFRVLAQGFADVVEMPTYPAFVGLFYGVAGAALVSLTSFGNALHLAFPLVAGFTLIGPFVAVGLYEMSRQREHGFPATWRDAFAVFRSPALPSILALGCILFVIFAGWIEAAQHLYIQIYGPNPPGAVAPFLRDVVTTERGHMLMALGALIGLFFAALALCISVVSFPLMLDRELPLVSAVAASLRISRDNPITIALWGAIVAVLLVVGQLLLFIGLAVVVPTLGHATWHLYRRAFEMELAADPSYAMLGGRWTGVASQSGIEGRRQRGASSPVDGCASTDKTSVVEFSEQQNLLNNPGINLRHSKSPKQDDRDANVDRRRW